MFSLSKRISTKAVLALFLFPVLLGCKEQRTRGAFWACTGRHPDTTDVDIVEISGTALQCDSLFEAYELPFDITKYYSYLLRK